MARNDAAFTGSIAQLYDHHLGLSTFAPYADDMAGRMPSITTGHVLETAAGTGVLTAALTARLLKNVAIVATDLNQGMLDHAATKHLPRVQLQQADALALPFGDTQFDVVVCQFGVMFFPDRVAGFREARRVLKPGGRFLFNVWDNLASNPVMAATIAGLAQRYPQHPSWFLERTPCGYHDPARIRTDLIAAGFADCTIETVALAGHFPSARGPAIGFCQGSPMRGEIETLDPGGLEPATEAAAAAIAARFGDGAFTGPMRALVIEASK
jgi:SAM-dependent methyltransferase